MEGDGYTEYEPYEVRDELEGHGWAKDSQTGEWTKMENVDIAPPNMDFGPSDSTTYSAENPMLVRERVCFDTDDSKFGEFQIKNEEREVEIND